MFMYIYLYVLYSPKPLPTIGATPNITRVSKTSSLAAGIRRQVRNANILILAKVPWGY